MKERLKDSIIGGGILLLLIVLDQYTKMMAVERLKDKPGYVIIEGVFELQYVENRGAAFGMLSGWQGFFLFATIAVSVYLLLILYRMPKGRYYLLLRIALIGIIAGAWGNFIDRVLNGFVVDFFYFSLINFPVFNVADCYVTISAALLFYGILFFYQDEDLLLFSLRKGQKQSKGDR